MLLIPFKTIWKVVSSQGPREFWREFSSPTGPAPLGKPGLDCSEPRWQQLHEAHLDIERSGLAVSAARTRVLFYMHSFNNIILGAIGSRAPEMSFYSFCLTFLAQAWPGGADYRMVQLQGNASDPKWSSQAVATVAFCNSSFLLLFK